MEAEGKWYFKFKDTEAKMHQVQLITKMKLIMKCTVSNSLSSVMREFHTVLLFCVKLKYVQKYVSV